MSDLQRFYDAIGSELKPVIERLGGNAETLKGICLSLGFGCLYRHAAAVTELLRGGDITAARQAFPALEQEYIKVTGLLREL